MSLVNIRSWCPLGVLGSLRHVQKSGHEALTYFWSWAGLGMRDKIYPSTYIPAFQNKHSRYLLTLLNGGCPKTVIRKYSQKAGRLVVMTVGDGDCS